MRGGCIKAPVDRFDKDIALDVQLYTFVTNHRRQRHFRGSDIIASLSLTQFFGPQCFAVEFPDHRLGKAFSYHNIQNPLMFTKLRIEPVF